VKTLAGLRCRPRYPALSSGNIIWNSFEVRAAAKNAFNHPNFGGSNI
jgi:hypothetical protein